MIRVLGASFLILMASNRLPAPFAPVAGGGDIVAGAVAVPVAWLVYQRAKGWRTVLMAWNLFGLADLIAAVTLGVLSSPFIAADFRGAWSRHNDFSALAAHPGVHRAAAGHNTSGDLLSA